MWKMPKAYKKLCTNIYFIVLGDGRGSTNKGKGTPSPVNCEFDFRNGRELYWNFVLNWSFFLGGGKGLEKTALTLCNCFSRILFPYLILVFSMVSDFSDIYNMWTGKKLNWILQQVWYKVFLLPDVWCYDALNARVYCKW